MIVRSSHTNLLTIPEIYKYFNFKQANQATGTSSNISFIYFFHFRRSEKTAVFLKTSSW